MNEAEPILLTGVFLPQIDYANLWSYSAGSIGGAVFIPLVEDVNQTAMAKTLQHFEHLCITNNIDYRIHKDFKEFALTELKKETSFADLLILGSESFYENVSTGEPNEYMQETLHKAKCPVIIVPEVFDFPENNILAYDGTDASVYAIKQFAYLFPALANKKTLLVYSNENTGTAIPENSNIEELAARHFTDLSISKLNIEPRKFFASWYSQKKAAILVSGSFGRSSVSRMFKKSFINDIIKEHKLPVFITHR